ncbi:MAG: grpE [Microbacteriaceae bacterium]|jgi:molecular chaperone GrpE|nr:grpE [Microbacteriaceae bacterium]
MVNDKKNGEDGFEEPDPSTGPDDGLIEAEGPDVETSVGSPDPVDGFTDDDLAFLAGERPSSIGTDSEVDPAVEILGDLKRVQAEFANYRKRVERDREANRELNIAEVMKSLLPVLDDLVLAETHGDLADGPMAVIAQKLRASLERFGLTVVGEKGDVFDPHLHEALVQLPDPDVTVNTVADVIAPGYKLGERLLRPAKVAVSVPAE